MLSTDLAVGVISASRSLERDLRRLLEGWVSVDLLATHDQANERHAALLDCTRAGMNPAIRHLDLLIPRNAPAIDCYPPPWKRSFDVLCTTEKMELLGTLAKTVWQGGRTAERQGGRAAGRWSAEANRQIELARAEATDRIEELLRPRPLYGLCASVQMAFSLHVSVHDMSARLGCSEQTIRRWFRHSGKLRPERLFQWIRMCVVAHSVRRGVTVEVASAAFGFQHVESIRRSMRLLTGLSPSGMRSDDLFEAFSDQMRFATLGERRL